MSAASARTPRWRRVLDRVDEALNLGACAALAVMLVAVLVQVATRYLLNDPVGGVVGLSEQFLMPLVVFLTLSWVQMHGGHIRVTALWDRLGSRARRRVGRLVDAAGALLFGAIAWAVGSEAWLAWQMGYETSGDISVPLVWALAVPTFGSALMMLRLAVGACWPDDASPDDGSPLEAF